MSPRSAATAPTGCRVLFSGSVSLSSSSLNSHTFGHMQKHHVCPFACCRRDDSNRAHPSAHCGGKKLFSNILHLPLFISLPWRMPLTACKLIYNAVSPPGWVEDGWVSEAGVPPLCLWKGKESQCGAAVMRNLHTTGQI